jgi:hypothetical protein
MVSEFIMVVGGTLVIVAGVVGLIFLFVVPEDL